MQLIYSPWMKQFLHAAQNSREQLVLVSPFIKLSLVRPLLNVLPDIGIEIIVVTRFNKLVFQQQASDLAALELLQTRPVAPGPTRIYVLNRLHAKLYIFDKKRIFLGSSNLSISGLDRNFEMAVAVEGVEIASNILKQLDARSLFSTRIKEADFLAMRETMQINDGLSEQSLEAFESTSILDDRIDIEQNSISVEKQDEQCEEDLLQQIVFDESRDRQVSEFILKSIKPEFNHICGKQALSIGLLASTSKEDRCTPEFALLAERAAREDLENIYRHVFSILKIDDPNVDKEAIVSPFVQQSWCETYKNVLSHGLTWQRFRLLGSELINLEAAIILTKPIAFDIATAGAAEIAARNQIARLPFAEFLRSKGLTTLLHVIDSSIDLAPRNQVESIVGLLGYYNGHSAARRFIRQFLQDNLPIDLVYSTKKDAKTVLNGISHELPVSYKTERLESPENAPLFSSIVRIGNRSFDTGTGPTKKHAEQAAAELAIRKLRTEPYYASLLEEAEKIKVKTPMSAYFLSEERRYACLELANKIGLSFMGSVALMDIALTHPSYLGFDRSARSYQRLAYIGSFISNALMRKTCIANYGWKVDQGDFSIDASAHRYLYNKVLIQIFDCLSLGSYLRLGHSKQEQIIGAIKIDTVQALLAAVFFWEGFQACERLWKNIAMPLLLGLLSQGTTKPPASELQELVQSIGLEAPRYEYKIKSPRKHQIFYVVHCYIGNELISVAESTSKARGRGEAALAAISIVRQKFNKKSA